MHKQAGWRERAHYWLDNTFSRGTGALILWLGVLSVLIVLAAAAVLALSGLNQDGEAGGLSFWEAAWEALMRTLDAGTMGGDTGWGFRLVMFAVTVGGVFIISSLIGVLTTGMDARLENLRKGRSRVIEHQHTVILGWSEQVFTILNELCLANSNHRGRSVVVLADQDKVEMEDAIAEKVDQRGLPNRTRIICRTGSPIDTHDLAITNLNQARAVIVLSRYANADSDAEVIKTVLAILHWGQRKAGAYHLVAELREPHNFNVAQVVGRGEVEWILVGDLVARALAQTCRQSGLSAVYDELLGFGGVEVYFAEQPELTGVSFGAALGRFAQNSLLGLQPRAGAVKLNPPMDTVIGAGDQLILLAEDDDLIERPAARPAPVQAGAIARAEIAPPGAERTLVLGWNWRGATLLRELDHYVAPGSSVHVVADLPDFAALVNDALAAALGGGQGGAGEEAATLANQRVTTQQADTTSRRALAALDLGRYDHVIVLSYLGELSAQQSDARTLITLLHLRDLADRRGWHFSITSEILDVRNRDLAAVTRTDDFIVSDRLVSLMLAQVAEEKHLNAVYNDLFSAEGSEIYLKPAQNYVRLGEAVTFATVVESARQLGEVAFGVRAARAHAPGEARAYAVTLNPPKSQTIVFQPGDRIVVLAED